jgi:ribosome maturation factor RimP
MLNEEVIKSWITEFLEGTDRFLVDVKVKVGDLIWFFWILIHHLQSIIALRSVKMIENRLDREEYDFELRVSSAGLDHPFTLPRQYIKNIGRSIEVELRDGTFTQESLLGE